MNRKLPADAFGLYFAMGPERSYSKLAKELGVNKRTITTRATAEKWQQRIEDIERKAREQTDKKAVETIEAMNSRHLRTYSAIAGKGLEALKSRPIESAIDAVRAIDLALKGERALRGDGTERTESVIAETTKREMAALLEVEDKPDGG